MEKLSKSLENYLYKMYELYKNGEKISLANLSSLTGFNKASTLDAIKTLKKENCVDYIPYKKLELTDYGIKYSKNIELRKNITANFLKQVLFMEDDLLKQETDIIEYYLTDTILNRFNSYLCFFDYCPVQEKLWASRFETYLKSGEISEDCAKCIENTLTGNSEPLCEIK